ncbi:MAG TPA: sigma-70 family RNA polymerase sigma factor [Ilumatobacteraceae bacterium]|nr:sigma-70 family RNA polymerase sigma factor [Ilumatobacteraceae bacterium]
MRFAAVADGGDDSLARIEPADVWPTRFVDLYRGSYAPMVRLAHLLTAADPAAEELVQDAFLRVQSRWDRIDNPLAYLRAAVVNACRNHQRRRVLERRHRAVVVGPAEDAPDELRDAITALPTRQRAAIVLRYYEDLAEVDIADLLGCSVPAVKSLLHRAVQDLRKVIER